MIAVIDAEYPIPTHVEASSAVSSPQLMSLDAQSPIGPGEGLPVEFRWDEREVPPPFRLVVLEESYEDLLHIDDIGEPHLRVQGQLATSLGQGGVFHWFVEGGLAGRTFRSALRTFEIR